MNFPTEKETVSYFNDLLDSFTLTSLLETYCKERAVSVDEVTSRSRKQEHVKARYEFSMIAKEKGYQPVDIAEVLNRDRTAVLHYFTDYIPPK